MGADNPASSRRRLLLGATPAFMLGLTFGFGKIIRDCSLTCSVGYQWAPLAILAVALVTLPVAGLHVRMEQRHGFLGLQTRSLLIAAASFLVFRGLTFGAVEWFHVELDAGAVGGSRQAVRLAYLGFFVWLGAIGAILGPNVKMIVTRLHPKRQQATALALGAAAVVTGGLLGSAIAGSIAPFAIHTWGFRYEHARDLLFFAMAGAMLATLPFVRAIDRRLLPKATPTEDGAREPSGDLWTRLGQLIRAPRLRKLALLIVLTGIAETMMVYVFYWVVSEQTAPSHGRTQFFANYYLLLNGGTLLLLVFGTNRVINRLGLLFAILSLPITLLFGSIYLLIHTALIVVYVLRIAEEAIEQALYGQGLDRLVFTTDLDPEDAHVLLGLIPRLGRGVGAAVVLILALALALPIKALLGVYVGVVAIWIIAALSMRRDVSRKRRSPS